MPRRRLPSGTVPRMPSIVTRLLVIHLDSCLAFYRDALGLPVLWHQPGGTFASLRVGAGKLQLFDRAAMAAAVGTTALPADAPAQDRAAVVLEVDDVDALAARLRAHGLPFIAVPHDRPDWSARVAHLRDPAGNLVELCQDTSS
jgi:lactoylglutathione lyase